MAATRKTGENLYLRLVKATVEGVERLVMVAADRFSADMLKGKNIRRGDKVRAWVGKERDGRSWNRAHALGQLLVDNIEGYEHLNAHQALKRLQTLAGVECDDTMITGVTVPCPHCGGHLEVPAMQARAPRSLAYDHMDEMVFQTVYTALRKYIKDNYWPECSEAQIDQMASLVENY
jgi:hypothetical protein